MSIYTAFIWTNIVVITGGAWILHGHQTALAYFSIIMVLLFVVAPFVSGILK